MKALIVDDEPNAIQNLQQLCARHFPGTFTRIDSAQSLPEALQFLEREQPDVLFLDIHLKDASGFDVLSRAPHRNFRVIFVTAHDHYAIKAIKLNAFDYLLKPVDVEELGACLERLNTLPAASAAPEFRPDPDYILFRDAYTYEKIPFDSILFLEAAGPYTTLVYYKEGKVVRFTRSKSLYEFEELLPRSSFVRIHRSYVVNLQQVQKIIKEKDNFFVQLEQQRLPVSRRRFAEIEARIEKAGS